ncbi:putative exostosin [Helianthus annuus]|uniref:Exostosin n=1 Tax=Helianthus annuus TaxID=4232 RepID=A0A251SJ00_HELAN|nr:xyloglucan galactosyltransferase XLT2 [Helianthus annuus]KAF5769672.1 putative exostosin [Helianthus annuus]KAJ0469272.1 putative exostosin [Helianthus annuus]KAJ0486243.1 putative exostosin [Helianthus annuus]KAJ0840909.1 putative exostosin [Helianthus annuus]KAJ0854350.1 putative exostosin [Helianthus annuus]
MFTFNKTIIHSIHSHITSHPLISLFILTLFLIEITLFCSHSPPPQPLFPPTDNLCTDGTIYVYDLPPMFNSDLLGTCDDLDPWHWQCGVATNHGYGTTATELAGIVPESLASAWHRTNQFSSEVIFHNRVLKHKCRTMEPESATAYYIPFYAGLAVGKYLFSDSSNEERDFHAVELIKWVQDQPYWRRSNGSDHVLVLGRITWDFRRLTDPEKLWGSTFLNMPEMQNVTRLTIERAPYDYHDIGVPYPTGFHPTSVTDIRTWQSFVRTYNRTSLFTFVGAAREDIGDDIRGLLLRTCRNESGSGSGSGACRVVDCALTPCANGSKEIIEALLGSEFCLQPRGDSFTRRSVFDCMIAGSVPVLFWNRTMYDQYEWYMPEEPESYSVFIDHGDVSAGKRSIKAVLESYSVEKVRRMREKVIEIIPKIVYSNSNSSSSSNDGMKDAFEIAVEGVLKRFGAEREQLRLESVGKGFLESP